MPVVPVVASGVVLTMPRPELIEVTPFAEHIDLMLFDGRDREMYEIYERS
jgi:hypothetical protein